MHTDWNGNGKHDWSDDYIDYKLSSSQKGSGGSGGGGGNGSTSLGCAAVILVFMLIGIFSSNLDITNPFTLLVTGIAAVVVWNGLK